MRFRNHSHYQDNQHKFLKPVHLARPFSCPASLPSCSVMHITAALTHLLSALPVSAPCLFPFPHLHIKEQQLQFFFSFLERIWSFCWVWVQFTLASIGCLSLVPCLYPVTADKGSSRTKWPCLVKSWYRKWMGKKTSGHDKASAWNVIISPASKKAFKVADLFLFIITDGDADFLSDCHACFIAWNSSTQQGWVFQRMLNHHLQPECPTCSPGGELQ